MEYSPPPLFKQGPSAFARLAFFVTLSCALLIGDARFNVLEMLHGALNTAIYPLQRIALMPRDFVVDVTDLLITNVALLSENKKLTAQNLQLSLQANQVAALSAENAHLRAILTLTQRINAHATPAEIQYDARDPFSQKIVIGSGAQQGIQNGSPVVNEEGLIGQITRVFPFQSEVTLLTDKDQAVPVEALRTGLRGILYGTPSSDTLELRFVPNGADLLPGDELVTSGLDGIYPQGLPVAKIIYIEKQTRAVSTRIVCTPIAMVRGTREVLVLHYHRDMPPHPQAQQEALRTLLTRKIAAPQDTPKPARLSPPQPASATSGARR